MPGVVWIAIAVLVAFALVLVVGVSRLRALSHRVGSFPCGARAAGNPQGAWTLGIAQYGVGRIDWWRCWSLSPRPARTWQRERLEVTGRVPLDQAGQPDQYLVQCRYDGLDFELNISAGDYTGLASWLEAAPPGRRDLVL
ncbi:DUF2550 domain-containing protein [Antribacter gilvus]|uniref:DUF2550 domain-containing protein n=1 Tax=Antribacter gilvus TaxID=2304675 RepID=UPI000F77A8EE|nr:DUF2550 domain-containing protein [Antribacter gilvus]